MIGQPPAALLLLTLQLADERTSGVPDSVTPIYEFAA